MQFRGYGDSIDQVIKLLWPYMQNIMVSLSKMSLMHTFIEYNISNFSNLYNAFSTENVEKYAKNNGTCIFIFPSRLM